MRKSGVLFAAIAMLWGCGESCQEMGKERVSFVLQDGILERAERDLNAEPLTITSFTIEKDHLITPIVKWQFTAWEKDPVTSKLRCYGRYCKILPFEDAHPVFGISIHKKEAGTISIKVILVIGIAHNHDMMLIIPTQILCPEICYQLLHQLIYSIFRLIVFDQCKTVNCQIHS